MSQFYPVLQIVTISCLSLNDNIIWVNLNLSELSEGSANRLQIRSMLSLMGKP